MNNFWDKIIKPIFVLAPMDGVTNYEFREIVCSCSKPDVVFTEFINVDSLFSLGKEKSMIRLKYSQLQKPIVAQIWGVNIENFIKASELIVSKGFGGIDINMGCPSKSVRKRGAGSALIENYTLAETLIKAVKKGSKEKIPLSVKTRIGPTDEITTEWISFLLKQDIQALTVHVRKAINIHKDKGEWDKMDNIINLKNMISPKTLIIGNGGIKDKPEGIRIAKEKALDGVMIASHALKNPWCFETEKIYHSKEEKFNLLIKHLKLLEKNKQHNFKEINKFLKTYVNNFQGSAEFRQTLYNCTDLKQLLEIILNSNI